MTTIVRWRTTSMASHDAARARARARARAAYDVPNASNARRSTLIVDDEYALRRRLRSRLEKLDVKVFEAETAPQAIAVAERERPGLVVLDVRLLSRSIREEDTSGLDVLKHLRNAGYEEPI